MNMQFDEFAMKKKLNFRALLPLYISAIEFVDKHVHVILHLKAFPRAHIFLEESVVYIYVLANWYVGAHWFTNHSPTRPLWQLLNIGKVRQHSKNCYQMT